MKIKCVSNNFESTSRYTPGEIYTVGELYDWEDCDCEYVVSLTDTIWHCTIKGHLLIIPQSTAVVNGPAAIFLMDEKEAFTFKMTGEVI